MTAAEEHHRRLADQFVTHLELVTLQALADDREDAHRREHIAEREALAKALSVSDRDHETHTGFHDREHLSHQQKHEVAEKAVETALEAVARERSIHAEAHEREHLAHQREHGLNDKAIEKAEIATNLQFTNAADTLDTLRKDTDRRINELRNAFEAQAVIFRNAITAIEKGDVKSEGRGLGQASVIAAIVTGVTLVGGILGILLSVATRGGA